MKYPRLFLFLLIAVAGLSVSAYAQQPGQPADDDDRPDGRRPNLLAELNLSPQQIQQIRRMNQERRPRVMEARRRMGDAARNLDLAIYSDSVNDAEFQTRLKEFQAAEAELSRLRFESELAVRKVLTSEQLVRFLELRRQFHNNQQQPRRDRRFPPMQEGPFRRPVND